MITKIRCTKCTKYVEGWFDDMKSPKAYWGYCECSRWKLSRVVE
jgi:hypothetical protein